MYEAGETVHGDAEVMVEPGTTGFVRAFVDEFFSLFDCDSGVLRGLHSTSRRNSHQTLN